MINVLYECYLNEDLFLNIFIKQEHLLNCLVYKCKILFVFVVLYLALYVQYWEYVKKFIDNFRNNSPWV